MPDIARQWFIPGDGIDRHVISADIQRYLGNDATVRPGQGTGGDQGISGYWIKAYRNLTNAMIADLRADSARWRQEQRATGTRGSYEGSSTYNQSSAVRVQRREADSPSLEPSYQSRERMPPMDNRRGQPVDPMQIDSAPQPDRRGHSSHHGQPARGGFPPDPRGFAPPQENRGYPADTMMTDSYGRPPVTSSYAADPRYAPSYPPQPNDSAMSGFGRQPPPSGAYYSEPPAYDTMPAMSGRPSDPSQYPGPQYGQPQQVGRQDHYRDPRDPRADAREPRYPGHDFRPSDAYPSPAATVSSMTVNRDRDTNTSLPNPSMYSQPSYQSDPYGQTMQARPSAPSAYPSSGSRDGYQRERPPPSAGDSRDARRRRH